MAACGLAACAALLTGAGPAHAANYIVNSTADGPDTTTLGDGVCDSGSGACTLRAAMQDAQALGGTNTITLLGLPDPSTLNPGSARPTIAGQTLTITGAGPDALTVRRDSGGDYSIFTVVPSGMVASNVSIRGMTITNGRAAGSPSGYPAGGGIYSLAGSLELDDVAVVGNAAVSSGESDAFVEGGGIYKEQGTLTIRNSTISQNTLEVTGGSTGLGFGGGIAQVAGDLEVVNSTIGENSVSVTGSAGASAHGGGIASSARTVEIVDSTVRDNTAAAVATGEDAGADAHGGGIEVAVAQAFTMVTSTVDHNAATADASIPALVVGGGIYAESSLALAVTNSTISANSVSATPGVTGDVVAGGGIGILSGALTISGATMAFNAAPLGANLEEAANSVRLRNTIVSDPLGGGADCYEFAPDTIVSDGYNVASDASCNLGGVGDQPSTNPLLGALADNGGPTWTHALPLASPAVDRGDAAASGTHPALTTDQRGQPRPFDRPTVANAADGSDVGAFELHGTESPPAAVDDAYAVTGGGVLTVAAPGVLGNDIDADGDPLTAQLAAGPPSGVLTLRPDGSFTYAPSEDAVSGVVTFTYQAFDGQALSHVATVTITVRAGCDGVPATIVGTAGNDTLDGTGGNDVIVGLGGNDTIDAGSGDDRVCGGSGRDGIEAGSGDDRLFGGTGNDSVRSGSGNDTVFGGDGGDLLDGGGDRDRLFGEGGVDQLFGGGDPDQLDGGAGSPDHCDGQGASDTATACEVTTSVP
jgi:Ca2+-binding RTX toxin-like protein